MGVMEPVTFPPELAALVVGVAWAQVTLGESGAQVYRLHTGAATRYLKLQPRHPHGALHAEAARLRWLQGRLPVPRLLYAGADARTCMMPRAASYQRQAATAPSVRGQPVVKTPLPHVVFPLLSLSPIKATIVPVYF